MTTSDTSRPSSSITWALWLLIIVLFSTLIAACVAALKYVTGTGIIDAILFAGAAFGATAGLCFAAVGAVTALRNQTETNVGRSAPPVPAAQEHDRAGPPTVRGGARSGRLRSPDRRRGAAPEVGVDS